MYVEFGSIYVFVCGVVVVVVNGELHPTQKLSIFVYLKTVNIFFKNIIVS